MVKGPKWDKIEIELFELIKKVKYDNNENAYDKVCEYVRPYIDIFCKKFVIAGLANDDIEQECLFALRYKAIDDFNPSRGRFKTFAVLCIKRHLFSIIKGNSQHKKKALNVSLSLDESHDDQGEELSLRNLISDGKMSVDKEVQKKEDDELRQEKLIGKLSEFERDVFLLYKDKYHYDEIVEMLTEAGRKGVSRKSIDNSCQRIKAKAKKMARKKDFW